MNIVAPRGDENGLSLKRVSFCGSGGGGGGPSFLVSYLLMRRLLGLGQISVSVFNSISRTMPAASGSTAFSSAISAAVSA